jgi:hypothetical protein
MLLLACISLLTGPLAEDPAQAEPVRVVVDSSQRRVVLTAGPFTIPGGSGSAHHAGMHDAATELPVMKFTWPVQGWARGVSLSLTNSAGKPLPRALVHHVNVVNFGRRQLLYPAAERLIAIGQETEDIRLPATVGIPVEPGLPMGLVIAWHNEAHEAVNDVVLTLSMEYSPENLHPRPVSVLPLYMDVIYPIARPADFDLPPGVQTFSAEFKMPINGRIIGAGGHLHDYGTGLKLEELTGDGTKALLQLDTRRDKDGKLIGVDRKFPGVSGPGIKLTAGRSYRMSGNYRNPTGETLERGAMVHLILLFAPDSVGEWPGVDISDADYAKDIEWLQSRGRRQ